MLPVAFCCTMFLATRSSRRNSERARLADLTPTHNPQYRICNDVSKQAWFIPGRSSIPGGPLARYLPVQAVRVASAYVQSLTQPDDLVVDLFCQGPSVVQETVVAGRRALGLSVNPLLLVAAQLGLQQLDADTLKASLTHLADSPKGAMPLHRHMAILYSSACPTCRAPGIAEWFAWDRDGGYPFKKAVRCPRCEEVQEGTPDDADLEAARRIPLRGIAYYYALDRAAPPRHPAREQAAALVELYTPRNLSALMDMSIRLEGQKADEESRIALTAVMIACFDAGSGVDPYGEMRPRPRTLRIPSYYIERNVWLRFEEELSRLLSAAAPPTVPRAADTAALVRGETEGYALVNLPARDVGEVIPPRSVALIFTDPPRPDAVLWALSALWTAWLWDSPAARALRPFLRRRRFDWHWHWRALEAAFKGAGPLLAPEGHLITLFSDSDGTLLESVCLAASSAGYVLAGWGHCPEVGHRLVWRWEPEMANSRLQTETPGAESLAQNLITTAQKAAVATLRARDEPAAWDLLHASAYTALHETGLLARAATVLEAGPAPLASASDAVRRAFEAPPLVRLASDEKGKEALWWLADSSPVAGPGATNVEPPLADRVEALVWDLLTEQPTWTPEALINAVYVLFDGPLTPDLTLVQVCIGSYSTQQGETRQLRPEDQPERRLAEIRALREDLAELGKRLGFQVGRRGGWDMRWLEQEQESHVFAISATAALGPHLLSAPAADEGAQRCLVLPGGRAQLAGLKLQRDPRLARAVETHGWQFVKFRHLRRLVAEEELDRHALKTVLGLDPIVEREAAQIPLF